MTKLPVAAFDPWEPTEEIADFPACLSCDTVLLNVEPSVYPVDVVCEECAAVKVEDISNVGDWGVYSGGKLVQSFTNELAAKEFEVKQSKKWRTRSFFARLA